jgi:hypothetical protein
MLFRQTSILECYDFQNSDLKDRTITNHVEVDQNSDLKNRTTKNSVEVEEADGHVKDCTSSGIR